MIFYFFEIIFAVIILQLTTMAKKESFYLNPLTDFGFYRVFGNEENKDLLIHFLNACISQYVGTITDIQYLPTVHYGLTPAEKKVIFDIYCRDQNGDHFIIEMQRARQEFFADRTITYVSRLVSKNAEKGKSIYDIAPVYSFNILDYDASDFSPSDKERDFFWQVMLKDNKNRIFSKKIVFFFVELTKFAAQINREGFKDEMSKWLYLLKNIGQMDEQDSTQESDIFRKFYETCRMSKLTTMEKEEYTKSVLEYEDVQDALDYMRKTSLKEGFEKGLAEGKAEGLAEGLAEGEAKAKLDLAKSMLDKGIDLNTVISITGLTAEEIN